MSNPSIISIAINNTRNNRALNEDAKGKGGSASHFVRPAGSFVPGLNRDPSKSGEDSMKFLMDLDFVDAQESAIESGAAFGKCLYFRATSDTPMYEAISDLQKIAPEDLQHIRITEAHHQDTTRPGVRLFELQGDIKPQETNEVHICIGAINGPNHEVTEENAVVYTWYPGRLTPPSRISETTVKCSGDGRWATDMNGYFKNGEPGAYLSSLDSPGF